MEKQKCSGCNVLKYIDQFGIRKLDIYYKTCISCREKTKIQRENLKCEHGKHQHQCRECGGKSVCEHSTNKSQCKICKGKGICEHNKIQSKCKECKGSQICEHNRERIRCKECKGSQICEHNRVKRECRECVGSAICEHNRRKYVCIDCQGNGTCEHRKRKNQCSICDINGYLGSVVRSRILKALNRDKTTNSLEYIGCDILTFKKHIQEQFKQGMTWENHGKVWHIDHIIPIKYNTPSIEEVIKRLHYTNTQPLWASENMSKGNRYSIEICKDCD